MRARVADEEAGTRAVGSAGKSDLSERATKDRTRRHRCTAAAVGGTDVAPPALCLFRTHTSCFQPYTPWMYQTYRPSPS